MPKKQSLKNKIRTEIIKIVSVPPERKGDTGYLKLTDEEIDKIVELFKKSIQRFIKETRIEEDKTDYRDTTGNTEEEGRLNYEINEAGRQGYNEAIGEIRQAQAKWLKENL